ncbi:hypothetical protein RJ639_008126 [Escallonia herrerae]|uniref:BED-type domain-containing protein n=1 Tax=Escallonia herrerae TaxID=1293975 RepID=A0AA88VT64_9ASTE|nr:hypothetical protein RJ639_008126 [Escallonia herrerae]
MVVREKDVCWEYAEKLDGNKVRCKFCFRVLNGGISRLKHHLSRLPSKGVNPCSKVRDDVTDRVRAIIASKEDVKEAPSAKKQKLTEARSLDLSASKALMSMSVEATSPIAKLYPSVTPTGSSPASDQENAERTMLDLLKKFTGGKEIIKTGITKSVSSFLSLQSILKQRSRLKHMFNSPEFSANPTYANKPQSITCIGILDDNDFWRAVEECVAVSEPFLKVMREVSGGKPAVGFIYELMTRAKESIRTYFIMDEIKCKTFLDIVDKKWQNHLHSSLHSAAAFLNPSIQYNPEIKFIGSIKEEFFRVLEKLLPTPELRRDITNQILLFTRATGMFGCNLAKEAIDAVSPEWVEEIENTSPTQWLDRFGSALDGSDLNTRQFSSSIFGASDHIFDKKLCASTGVGVLMTERVKLLKGFPLKCPFQSTFKNKE